MIATDSAERVFTYRNLSASGKQLIGLAKALQDTALPIALVKLEAIIRRRAHILHKYPVKSARYLHTILKGQQTAYATRYPQWIPIVYRLVITKGPRSTTIIRKAHGRASPKYIQPVHIRGYLRGVKRPTATSS